MNFKDPIIAKSSVKNGNKIQPIGKLCCYVHTMKYTKRILSLMVQTASEKEKERKRAENFRPVFRSDRSRAQLGKICEYETLLEEITIAPAISPLFSFFSQKYRELCRLKARPARRAESTKTTTTIAVTMDEPVSKCQTNRCNLLCRFDTFPREAHYRYLFFNIIIIRDIFLDEERIMDLSRRELNLFMARRKQLRKDYRFGFNEILLSSFNWNARSIFHATYDTYFFNLKYYFLTCTFFQKSLFPDPITWNYK